MRAGDVGCLNVEVWGGTWCVYAMDPRGFRTMGDGRWRTTTSPFPQIGRRNSVNELERGLDDMGIDHVHIL